MDTRRAFIKKSGLGALTLSFPIQINLDPIISKTHFDVIIVGGSYAGLAAAMALGRALRTVLIIDSGKPCNRQTPYSHNFLTQDGRPPNEIASLGKQQVENYNTISFLNDLAISGNRTKKGFEIQTATNKTIFANKLIFASGIKDIKPKINGFDACWGISILHCPYCHGYEVKNKKTGILGNGDYGINFSKLISNWTQDLTLFTNGKSILTQEETKLLEKHQIEIVEKKIEYLEHQNGYIQNTVFSDGTKTSIEAIYTKIPFEQHCKIPEQLGCELTDNGYIKTDHLQKTTIPDIYACGDNTTRMRTVANAVAMGTTAGMMLNKEYVIENFNK